MLVASEATTPSLWPGNCFPWMDRVRVDVDAMNESTPIARSNATHLLSHRGEAKRALEENTTEGTHVSKKEKLPNEKRRSSCFQFVLVRVMLTLAMVLLVFFPGTALAAPASASVIAAPPGSGSMVGQASRTVALTDSEPLHPGPHRRGIAVGRSPGALASLEAFTIPRFHLVGFNINAK